MSSEVRGWILGRDERWHYLVCRPEPVPANRRFVSLCLVFDLDEGYRLLPYRNDNRRTCACCLRRLGRYGPNL